MLHVFVICLFCTGEEPKPFPTPRASVYSEHKIVKTHCKLLSFKDTEGQNTGSIILGLSFVMCRKWSVFEHFQTVILFNAYSTLASAIFGMCGIKRDLEIKYPWWCWWWCGGRGWKGGEKSKDHCLKYNKFYRFPWFSSNSLFNAISILLSHYFLLLNK